MPHCIPVTVLSSFSLSLSLLSPVASLTQLVNTDAGLCGHDGKCQLEKTRPACIWRGGWAPSPLQSSLFALPSRGPARLCTATQRKRLQAGRQKDRKWATACCFIWKDPYQNKQIQKKLYIVPPALALCLLVLSYSPTVINMFHWGRLQKQTKAHECSFGA